MGTWTKVLPTLFEQLLAVYLNIVVAILFDILRVTVWATNNAIWPAVLTDHFKAGFITDEI